MKARKYGDAVRPDPYAWSAHPEALLGIALLAAGYVLALRSHRGPPWRLAAFALGTGLLLVAAVSPLDALTFHLLTAHLLQNILLAEWAPLLLVLGLPPSLAASFTRFRPLRGLTHPLVALPLWLTVYFLWHLPPLYDAALRNPSTLLHLEHGTYLAAGCLLWWPVVHDRPWGLPDGLRALYLFAAFALGSPLGLLLALLPDTVYGFYDGGAGLWGLSDLDDQRIAGVTMASEEAVLFALAFAYVFARFLRTEERQDALADELAGERSAVLQQQRALL